MNRCAVLQVYIDHSVCTGVPHGQRTTALPCSDVFWLFGAHTGRV